MDIIRTDFVRISDDERMRFIRHIFRDRRCFWLVTAAVGGVLIALGLTVRQWLVSGLGGALAFAGLADVFYIDYWARRMLRDPQNKAMHQRSRGIYTAEKVTIESEDGMVQTIPWTNIVKVEKLGDDYLLYVARNNALIIFRRNQTAEQWTQFSAWAEKRRTEL